MSNVIFLSSLGSGGFIIQGDSAGDRTGFSVSDAGDVNGDGFGDVIVGAHYGDDGGTNAGEAYVIFGKAGGRATIDLTVLAPADGFVIQGDSASDYAGFSVSGAGDVNGDGFGDIIVGARGGDDGGTDAGGAYVIFGKASGFSTVDLTVLASSAGFIIQGDIDGDQAGRSVSAAGDVNGDGFEDVIVGASYGDDGDFNAGEAYILFGKANGFSNIDLTGLGTADGFIIQGDAINDQAGRSVSSAGDVNGDGFADLIVGAPFGDDGGVNAGEAYVIFGKANGFGTVDLTGLIPANGFVIQGDASYDEAGSSVSSAGDVNGDGFDDIIVGAPNGDEDGGNAGEVYVIFGKASGFGTIDLAVLAAADGFIIKGREGGDYAGFSVSSAGDVNGDGFDDIIVGERFGGASIIFGKESGFGVVDLAGLSTSDGFAIQPDGVDDRPGQSVSGAGDVNGDGIADIIVGASYGDDGGSNAGEAYVIFGLAPTESVTRIGSVAGQAIYGGIGDDLLDGRDGDDILLGGDGDDEAFGGGGDDTLDGGGGSDALDGGGGGDTLSGAEGDDVLDGGSGSNVLSGGEGDDALVGGSGFDILDGGEGDDGLSGGSGNDALIGGAGIDGLSGGSGNDILDGGAGADLLAGGSGNDIYRIDGTRDRIMEADGGGTDRVFSRVNFTLAEDALVETLNTFANASIANIDLTGNSIANRITGNAGANTLSGGGGNDVLSGLAGADRLFGGSGNDAMSGGAGQDRFTFDTALDALVNVDRLSDFAPPDDAILLDRRVFGGFASDGVILVAAFRAGVAAQDDSDRIVYDQATGRIFHDPDGTGAAAQTLFARVDPGTILTRSDFVAFASVAEAAFRAAPEAMAAPFARSAPWGGDEGWEDAMLF